MKKAYFNWSSGKDSSLALYHALQSKEYDVDTLFTVVERSSGKIFMHETGLDLLKKQADSIAIPLTIFRLNPMAAAEEYEKAMQGQIEQFKARGITTALFGDLYLEELRKNREDKCNAAGITAAFPLWKKSQEEIMSEFIQAGFKAIVTCIDNSVLGESFAGRVIDESFLGDLPPDVDICGENGEYHTFVFDGPIFKYPVKFEIKDRYCRDFPDESGNGTKRYWYAELKGCGGNFLYRRKKGGGRNNFTRDP